MKILVIGLGSMGKRRINLLKKNFLSKYIIVGVDTRLDRRLEVEELFNIKTYSSLDEAISFENPNCALICTSPLTHSELIIKAMQNNMNVFTELNLINHRYKEIINLSIEKGLKIFLSSTLMYRREIQYIKEKVNSIKDKYHYRYHVGQYLPDWHPWEDFKDFFVADKRTNGCRELLAIELPWIISTFGKIMNLNVIRDSISSLKITYPDSYIIIMEHEDGHKGILSVDVVSRKPTRSLEIYSENCHIFWEGNPESLKIYDIQNKKNINIDTYSKYIRDNRYADNIIEDAYLEELRTFINMVEGKQYFERYTFEDDIYTLGIIDDIEGDI